jgi:hypothetical protein
MEEWQPGLWLIRNAIVRQYGQDAWAAIAAEVRKQCRAAPPVNGSRAPLRQAQAVPRRRDPVRQKRVHLPGHRRPRVDPDLAAGSCPMTGFR